MKIAIPSRLFKTFFKDLPPEKFIECRYGITTDSLDTTIENGIEELATMYGTDPGKPPFRFTPITEDAKNVWIKSEVNMTPDRFREEVENHPEAMFKDFKFCSLAVQVLFTEIHALHQITLCLDHNQAGFYKRLQDLTENLNSPPSESNDYLRSELKDRDTKIEDLNQQLIETNQIVTDLSILNRQKSISVNLLNSIPLSQVNEVGSRFHRSAKVDDPDQFYDEPDKDKLEFDAWRLGV